MLRHVVSYLYTWKWCFQNHYPVSKGLEKYLHGFQHNANDHISPLLCLYHTSTLTFICAMSSLLTTTTLPSKYFWNFWSSKHFPQKVNMIKFQMTHVKQLHVLTSNAVKEPISPDACLPFAPKYRNIEICIWQIMRCIRAQEVTIRQQSYALHGINLPLRWSVLLHAFVIFESLQSS